MDVMNKIKKKKKVAKFVKILSLAEIGIIGIWRSFNPLERNFTNYSVTHNGHSRIDNCFMNIGGGYRVNEGKIGGADVSDHNTL